MRHSFNSIRRQTQVGFTLIELMVAILALSVLAPLIIYSLGELYTDNISSLSKNAQDTNTLNSLQSVKNDLATAAGWNTSLAVSKPLGPTNSTTTNETWSYCGSNGASDCTVSGANRVLIAYTNATDKAPTDPTRMPVFANTAGSCDPNAGLNTVKVAQIYFVAADFTTPSQNDLYRRTVVNPAGDTICNGATPYQKNTCAPSVFSQANCIDANGATHQDSVLLTNVSSFTVDYYSAAKDGTAVANEYTTSSSAITSANTIVVTVSSSVRINGNMTPNTTNIRVSRQY